MNKINIKKPLKAPVIALSVLLLFFGISYLILKASGYTLIPVNIVAPLIGSTVITSTIVVLSILIVRKYKIKPSKSKLAMQEDKNSHCCKYVNAFMLMPLFTMIFVVGKAIGYETDGVEQYTLPVYAYIILLCGMLVYITCYDKKTIKLKLCIVNCVVLLPILVLVAFWDFSPMPVVATEVSKDGRYLAEVVRSDQGLFGRHTIVRVTRQVEDVSLPIGTLRKNPTRIYRGGYDEHKDIVIIWDSDNSLFINDRKFSVD